ncbi:MAG: metallophosphoesterase [bacterium]
MKLGIVSDTHDNLLKVKEIVDFFNNEKVEYVLHAGDIVAPFILLKGFKYLNCPLTAVFGNNDGDKLLLKKVATELNFDISLPPKKIVLDNINILMLHAPDQLDDFIQSNEYDLIIYGHTHRQEIRKVTNVTIINPGEAGGWLTGKSTVGIVELPSFEAKIVEIR